MTTLPAQIEGLQAILEKEVVLSTVNADDLIRNPQKVDDQYLRHVSTFIPMDDISNYSLRLIKKTVQAKTPKGMIVAPYGYGKTSTHVFFWKECERNGLVAIPPFYCATLLDILKATYGWVRFRLETTQPGLIGDLEEIYRKRTSATVEEMADRYARERGIATVVAIGMLQDMLADGNLILELTPSNLLFFLDAVTALVIRAGFKGLVLFPDEVQQYFSKGANLRRVVQEFREFVWGLDTRSNELGVVFSVPTYAEAVIQEQGKDIIARLKKDDLYYRLQDIYSVEFPINLWEQYMKVFRLGTIGSQVIERTTLFAIGQIAERDDLGEGPRTVVDCFKRAIACYQDRDRPYSPIDLMDDFLESNIRFQAQTNKLKIITRQAMDAMVVDSYEKRQAIKLLAVFPRGCPSTVQQSYGFRDAVVDLSRQSRGELLVSLSEGETLLGLNRSGGPTHIVDIIITHFWQGYEEDDLHIESALQAFNKRLLPRIFQQKHGAANIGWAFPDFSPSSRGSHVALVQGTFDPKYPRRFLGLQIAHELSQMQSLMKNADFQFDFLFLKRGSEDCGYMERISERVVRFHLNLQKKVGEVLPEDILKLQEFVLPDFVTPLLLLSLVNFFDSWEEISEQPTPEEDRPEIEHLVGRLIGHAEQMLFNRKLAESYQPPLRRVGRATIEELFNSMCAELFPNYYTFFVQSQYEVVIHDYINAILNMTLKERRGHIPIRGTKEAIARRFGLGSVATFENRIQNEYSNFINKGEWSGRGDQAVAEITLTLHPLEESILDSLRASSDIRTIEGRRVPVLTSNQIAELCYRYGYRDEEILLALQILAARGYSRFDPHDKIVYISQIGPDPDELKKKKYQIEAHIQQTIGLLTGEQASDMEMKLKDVDQCLEKAIGDEEELDEAQTLITDLNQQLSQILSDTRDELRLQLSSLVMELERILIVLRQSSVLDREIQAQVAFVMHLNELRQQLVNARRKLIDAYSSLKTELGHSKEEMGGGPIAEAIQLHQVLQNAENKHSELNAQKEMLETQVANLERWIKLLQDTDRLFNSLALLPDLREQLTDQVVPEIQAHLTRRRQDGLSDWEVFQTKVNKVEEELEKRRRHGNEVFVEVKEGYEKFLRDINVGDYKPHTRYTYGEDEESYRDLYEEVRAKIEIRLNEINSDLDREQTDSLKVMYIQKVEPEHKEMIQQIEKQLSEATNSLGELYKALNITLIKKASEELDTFCRQVNDVSNMISVVRTQIGPILFADHQLSPEEKSVLDALGTRNDVDLTDLFVNLRKSGQDVEMSDLLSRLEELYRKNRVMIKIRPKT